eukprot:COSAG01_NODE_58177_length_307_cov_1.826923_1_plen_50_part_10
MRYIEIYKKVSLLRSEVVAGNSGRRLLGSPIPKRFTKLLIILNLVAWRRK